MDTEEEVSENELKKLLKINKNYEMKDYNIITQEFPFGKRNGINY